VVRHATPGIIRPRLSFMRWSAGRRDQSLLNPQRPSPPCLLIEVAGSYNLGIAFGYCSIRVIRMCKLCLFIAFLLAASAGVLLAVAPHHQASANAVPVGPSVN
jgi:hypothetical protein